MSGGVGVRSLKEIPEIDASPTLAFASDACTLPLTPQNGIDEGRPSLRGNDPRSAAPDACTELGQHGCCVVDKQLGGRPTSVFSTSHSSSRNRLPTDAKKTQHGTYGRGIIGEGGKENKKDPRKKDNEERVFGAELSSFFGRLSRRATPSRPLSVPWRRSSATLTRLPPRTRRAIDEADVAVATTRPMQVHGMHLTLARGLSESATFSFVDRPLDAARGDDERDPEECWLKKCSSSDFMASVIFHRDKIEILDGVSSGNFDDAEKIYYVTDRAVQNT
ncbi:hypothetical protein GWI33_004257 [Rhynchophorus ferrugineus]|uniref:Uncharacterized protein n=1 Tax=Rhynchophorus ferrugineus TaxID=354439 RepID=A0A834MKJ6_RHYFE|nr:hypothetical protein GWI33_004257 [Rhynchophorus ferrugineus]